MHNLILFFSSDSTLNVSKKSRLQKHEESLLVRLLKSIEFNDSDPLPPVLQCFNRSRVEQVTDYGSWDYSIFILRYLTFYRLSRRASPARPPAALKSTSSNCSEPSTPRSGSSCPSWANTSLRTVGLIDHNLTIRKMFNYGFLESPGGTLSHQKRQLNEDVRDIRTSVERFNDGMVRFFLNFNICDL